MDLCFIMQYFFNKDRSLSNLVEELSENNRPSVASALTTLPVLPACASWIASNLSKYSLFAASSAEPFAVEDENVSLSKP